MKRQSVGIQSVIIGGIIAFISSIIGGLLVSNLTKNNEIETRLFEIKYNAYQNIIDEISNILNSQKHKEMYSIVFNIEILNYINNYKNYNPDQLNCDPKISREIISECTYGISTNCRHKCLNQQSIINGHIEAIKVADMLSIHNVISKNRLLIPETVFSKLIAHLSDANKINTYIDFESCLESDYCNIYNQKNDLLINSFTILLSEDLNTHFKK